MKILFVLENYHPKVGGVETLFKHLCERLALNGHRVLVVTTGYTGLQTNEIINCVEVRRVKVFTRYLFTILAFPVVFRLLKGFDFIHTTSYNAGVPAFFAAWFQRKPVIITFHEVWGRLWFNLPYMPFVSKLVHYLFEQFLLKLPFERFIAVSHSTKEALIQNGVRQQKIVVNYNGIDYDDFVRTEDARYEDAPFVFTYFGRLGISKGLDLLLGAAKEIKAKYPDTQLQLILPNTPAGLYNKIWNQIKKSGLETYIKWIHHLPFEELKRTLCKSNCVVIPSYSEGFCFAAVETIALGVPIISSGQTALKETVSGKYIEMNEQSQEALVMAMEKAIRGEWQDTPVRKFHLEDNIKRYFELYEDI